MMFHTPAQRMLAALVLLCSPAVVSAVMCGGPANAIAQIQGDGARSSLAGQSVTVEGIITLDARHDGGFQGFYLQQADDETDRNPDTSEALFIYTDRPGGDEGTRVRVSGRVKEFHGLTELTGISDIKICGREKLPEPVRMKLPWPRDREPENLENMRVAVADQLTVIDHYNLARYGELTLAANDQVMATEIMAPGPDAREHQKRQQRNRLRLDDASGSRNPRPIPWPEPGLSATNTVRAGDRIGRLTGILDFRFGAWRLQPESAPLFEATNPRPRPPTRPDSANLRVLTLNLGNFFNGNGTGEGFPAPRGARTQDQYQQQRARLVAAITAPDPDIVAVTEMENDGYDQDSAIADLARALGEHWRYLQGGRRSGSDAIRTDLLYRSDRVKPDGNAHRPDLAQFPEIGRPPLAQVFRPVESRQTLRIIVAHLKSKACGGAAGRDRDQGDGQGCYNHSRTQATQAILRWSQSLPAPQAMAGTLITGDINSYAMEDPLQLLGGAGYVNAVRLFHDCNKTSCSNTSYRYRGRAGTLDYSLISEGLSRYLVNAGVWSINAPEPPALGYQGPVLMVDDLPWRSSDHDPVITDFSL